MTKLIVNNQHSTSIPIKKWMPISKKTHNFTGALTHRFCILSKTQALLNS